MTERRQKHKCDNECDKIGTNQNLERKAIKSTGQTLVHLAKRMKAKAYYVIFLSDLHTDVLHHIKVVWKMTANSNILTIIYDT